MKRHLGLGSLVGGSILLLATQPVLGSATQVTGVQVNPGSAGMEVVLETVAGERPQVFTVGRGNALTADIINAQLSLPDGNGYLQNNPAPGISSVVVAQLDANSIRVTVTGESEAPQALVQQGDRRIVLSYNPAGGAASAQEIPVAPALTQAQAAPAASSSFDSLPQVSPGFGQIAQAAPGEAPFVPAPDVLVPNPEITVNGVPVPPSAVGYVPPLQPRAIAPPLGDISISNVNMSPSEIDLGTAERIPRLVLRDAPARDVLSLLARAAGLNVAYIGEDVRGLDDPDTEDGGGGDAAADAAPLEIRLSLDIENEPVQDVFNYVLRITGLQANRVGRTVFVGPRLPDTARSVITRTLRLNQVAVLEALPYLIAQGAERNEIQTRTEITILGEGPTARTVTNTTTEVELVTPERGSAPLPLRGLLVVPDERTNSMTLTGDPRKIEMATALLSQIDLRRRQVALNVKIIDVNLLATEDFGTSFSFGLGNDAYFVNDGGAAFFNFGDFRPAQGAEVGQSLGNPPIISNPYAGSNTFLDFDSPTVNIPGTAPGTVIIDQRPGATPFRRVDNPQGLDFLQRVAGISSNPFGAGITDFDLATDNIITIDAEGNVTVEAGEVGSATSALPSFFQFPRNFLASLQAQIVSGNAKILTDPTLVVQEGQEASVALTQDVVTNVTVNRDVTAGGVSETREFEIQDAGLTLEVIVNRIDDNGFVTLQVNPAVTAPSQNFDTGDGTITLLARRDLNSGQIRLRDGQTLILSGIIQEQDRTTVTKIPILGDIPILGALFRSTNRENTRQEVIVLLTPQILNDSDLSTFGYGYSPGQEAQDILQRRGVQVP